jgi:hypothetical protein
MLVNSTFKPDFTTLIYPTQPLAHQTNHICKCLKFIQQKCLLFHSNELITTNLIDYHHSTVIKS